MAASMLWWPPTTIHDCCVRFGWNPDTSAKPDCPVVAGDAHLGAGRSVVSPTETDR